MGIEWPKEKKDELDRSLRPRDYGAIISRDPSFPCEVIVIKNKRANSMFTAYFSLFLILLIRAVIAKMSISQPEKLFTDPLFIGVSGIKNA